MSSSSRSNGCSSIRISTCVPSAADPTLDPLALRSRGQEHVETGSTTGTVTDLHPAAVCQNDRLADGQPEPVACRGRLPRSPRTDERLEDALAIFRANPGPFVFYAQLQFAVVRDARRDADGATVWRVLDRVLKQVGEHALHLSRIHAN